MLTGLVLLLCLSLSSGQTNLLKNSDFENDDFKQGSTGWSCSGCTATFSTDSLTGSHSVQVTQRQAKWGSITQNLQLKSQTSYYFKAHLKLLNIPKGALTEYVNVMLFMESGSDNHQKYYTLGTFNLMQPNMWNVVGGDVTTPADLKSARVYFQPSDPEVNYLLDDSSLVEIPLLASDWKAHANLKIQHIRRADIDISVGGHASHAELSDVTAEIEQVKSEFGFGTATKAGDITDPKMKKYQDVLYKNFEWVTITNMLKWRMMEWSKGHINYDSGMNAVNELNKHGMKIRAHNLFWAVEHNNPAWLKGTTGQALIKEMQTRIDGIVPKTKGKVEHWDVDNEALHGDFFEKGTGDVNITMWMFKQTHKVDPKVKLWLNDFNIINSHYSAQNYINQALMMKANPDVPVYGLGIQSHMGLGVDLSALSLVKYRLDQMLSPGYPIWITELDVPDPDENKRADLLEDLFTLFFSTQQVEGITFWGVWDHELNDASKALYVGQDVKPTASGRRYEQLVKQRWRTKLSASLAVGHHKFRGYKGEYKLRVVKNGRTLHEENFTLTDSGAKLKVSLNGGDLTETGQIRKEIEMIREKDVGLSYPTISPIQDRVH